MSTDRKHAGMLVVWERIADLDAREICCPRGQWSAYMLAIPGPTQKAERMRYNIALVQGIFPSSDDMQVSNLFDEGCSAVQA